MMAVWPLTSMTLMLPFQVVIHVYKLGEQQSTWRQLYCAIVLVPVVTTMWGH